MCFHPSKSVSRKKGTVIRNSVTKAKVTIKESMSIKVFLKLKMGYSGRTGCQRNTKEVNRISEAKLINKFTYYIQAPFIYSVTKESG